MMDSRVLGKFRKGDIVLGREKAPGDTGTACNTSVHTHFSPVALAQHKQSSQEKARTTQDELKCGRNKERRNR